MARWRSGNAQACEAFSDGFDSLSCSRRAGKGDGAERRRRVSWQRADRIDLPSYVQLSTLGETLLEHDHEERALYDHDNDAASTAY